MDLIVPIIAYSSATVLVHVEPAIYEAAMSTHKVTDLNACAVVSVSGNTRSISLCSSLPKPFATPRQQIMVSENGRFVVTAVFNQPPDAYQPFMHVGFGNPGVLATRESSVSGVLTTNLATGETSTVYTTANEPSIPRSLSLMSFISETDSPLQSQEIIYVESSFERDSQSFINVEDVEHKEPSDSNEEALSIVNSTPPPTTKSTKRQRSLEASSAKHRKKQKQNTDDGLPKKESSHKKDKGKQKMI